MSINVTRSSMPDIEEYISEISRMWDSHWLTNNGELHQKLENQLVEYLDVSYLTLFTNGHLALENVIAAFDLSGEAITTPYTFISTTNAIVRNGLTPVFCDISPDDYTIDIDQIERLVTEATSAIVPVHVYGNICDVEKLEQLALKYDLKIIYDAAHAFGVSVNGRGIGNYGDASMFSFHATKVFNTIEGGAISCHDKIIKEKLEIIKNFGLSGEDASFVGSNAKMNEFQAAMGICNLRYVAEEISKRKAVAERYDEHLSGIDGVKLCQSQTSVEGNYSYYPVIFDGYRKTRDQIFLELKAYDINARKYFYPLISDYSVYREKHNSNDTPVAKHIADHVLTLPMYASLSMDDVDKICAVIKN